MKASLFLFVALTACNQSDDGRYISASRHGIAYQFPKKEVTAAVTPPDGRLFVRLEPQGANFHLILDEWADLPSRHGPEVPRISRLSDNRFGKFRLVQAEGGPVVCDLGPQPHFNCGILVLDGPVKWGVLFDKDQVKEVAQIRLQAKAAIQTYRR
jgi:hypothetical protein